MLEYEYGFMLYLVYEKISLITYYFIKVEIFFGIFYHG